MSDVTSEKSSRGGPVGFIGLGNMGGRMARCLVDAGVEVIGFDTVAANVADCGATRATSVKDVISSADVVLLSLPHSRIVESVVRKDGASLAVSTLG